ncbi:Protein of unknown function [Pyronema omphalodes CBS 100304]
MSPCA